MKRCPQCHFTFEDHEEVCDFDGTDLTPYPESPPKNPSLLLEGSFIADLVRSRVFLAILALGGVIASALLMGYYDAANQSNVYRPGNAQSSAAVVSLAPPADIANKPAAQSQAQRPTQSRVKPRAQTRVRLLAQSRVQLPAQTRIRPLTQSRVQLRAQTRIQAADEPASETLTRQPGTLLSDPSSAMPRQATTAILPGAQAPSGTPIRQRATAFENAPREKESTPIVILKKTGNLLKKTVSFLKKPFEP